MVLSALPRDKYLIESAFRYKFGVIVCRCCRRCTHLIFSHASHLVRSSRVTNPDKPFRTRLCQGWQLPRGSRVGQQGTGCRGKAQSSQHIFKYIAARGGKLLRRLLCFLWVKCPSRVRITKRVSATFRALLVAGGEECLVLHTRKRFAVEIFYSRTNRLLADKNPKYNHGFRKLSPHFFSS